MDGWTRRGFLQRGAVAGAALYLPLGRGMGTAYAQAPPPLDAASVPKYVTDLAIPGAMPPTLSIGGAAYYEIAVRQFAQQVLPPGLPRTTVWGYGSKNHPWTFGYPAATIEARHGRPVRVRWVNDLVDRRGRYLPHLLPVDPTLHWANPPGGAEGRDSRPEFASTPGPYTGPVPLVPHLHGGHTREDSDGYPEAWFLPDATDIPRDYARTGTWYDRFRRKAQPRLLQPWPAGSAVFQYENDQPAATLWYHDHALGMTRVNVYAGPAGFYLIRGGPHDLGPGALPGERYEIPIAVQDRSFDADGALLYPGSRADFDGFEGPYIPESDIAPIHNPEVFGTAMVVNGRTWPRLEVERRRYRLRLLNGCNSRFVILRIATSNGNARPTALPFWQIGADGGFLDAPVSTERLLMGPAERADVIVDFASVRPGTRLYLINEGPDEPFGGGAPGTDFAPADPATTGQVMRFDVVARSGPERTVAPDRLDLPAAPAAAAATRTRELSLTEHDSDELADVGPRTALLGTVEDGVPMPMPWHHDATETPALGATEDWELHNRTEDAHPIHLHQVQFRILGRRGADGAERDPEPGEAGPKDTVIAYPGEVTRLRATFDLPGQYVWHCHVVEHEDNEMMRPLVVGG